MVQHIKAISKGDLDCVSLPSILIEPPLPPSKKFAKAYNVKITGSRNYVNFIVAYILVKTNYDELIFVEYISSPQKVKRGTS